MAGSAQQRDKGLSFGVFFIHRLDPDSNTDIGKVSVLRFSLLRRLFGGFPNRRRWRNRGE